MSKWIAIALGLQFLVVLVFYWIAIRPFFNDRDSDSDATASHWDQ